MGDSKVEYEVKQPTIAKSSGFILSETNGLIARFNITGIKDALKQVVNVFTCLNKYLGDGICI